MRIHCGDVSKGLLEGIDCSTENFQYGILYIYWEDQSSDDKHEEAL